MALNFVTNGKIYESKLFDNIWIQPAAGDAGGALGSALAARYVYFEQIRKVGTSDSMQGAYLGPEFSNKDIYKLISEFDLPHKYFDNFDELAIETAGLIEKGNVIGWFQGRMEYGPRALGNRSILGDARNAGMQKK